MNALEEQNLAALRTILERDAHSPPREPYAKSLGDFYASCIDEDAIEKDGTRALDVELARIQSVHDPVTFARALAHLHTIGVNALFNVFSHPDFKDATKVSAVIDQGGLGMPDRDYYLNDDPPTALVRSRYGAHAEKMFVLLGEKEALAKKDAGDGLGLREDPRDRTNRAKSIGAISTSSITRWTARFWRAPLPRWRGTPTSKELRADRGKRP